MNATNVIAQFSEQLVYFESTGSASLVIAFQTFWRVYDYTNEAFSQIQVTIDSSWELKMISHYADINTAIVQSISTDEYRWIAGTSLSTSPNPNGNFIIPGLNFLPSNLHVYDINGSLFKLYYTHTSPDDEKNWLIIAQISISSDFVNSTTELTLDLSLTIG
jgi:hypothetical protein